jgi:hypothetical protein
VIPPITEAMMIRCQLHAILEKHGIVDERKRAVCGLEILIWIKKVCYQERSLMHHDPNPFAWQYTGW